MRVLSLFYLLGLCLSAICKTCPPPEDISPCTCKSKPGIINIFVECSDIMISLGDLRWALNSISRKEDIQLTLHKLKLGKVPSNFFSGISIKSLYIVECKLESLSSGVLEPALLGLEDSLKDLRIISSLTEENVPARLNLGHLRKLKVLKMSLNNITELSNDWFFNGPTSLEYLIISDNEIKKLGERAFANLTNLIVLQLRGNSFGPVQRSMFPDPTYKLEWLLVENNTLAGIPKDFFRNMPSLKVLSLYKMGLSELKKRIWKRVLKKLKKIDLRDNPLKCDSHMTWVFDLRVTEDLLGECKSPTEKNGMRLLEFINRKGQ